MCSRNTTQACAARGYTPGTVSLLAAFPALQPTKAMAVRAPPFAGAGFLPSGAGCAANFGGSSVVSGGQEGEGWRETVKAELQVSLQTVWLSECHWLQSISSGQLPTVGDHISIEL